jgi:hypothetical protein
METPLQNFRSVEMLGKAGDGIGLAEEIHAALRATQAALMSGDPAGAHRQFDRATRLATRLSERLTTVAQGK